MRKNLIGIEGIKSAVIVVLFIMTILLLSFFWRDVSISDWNITMDILSSSSKSPSLEYEQLVCPEKININFSSELATVVSSLYEVEEEIFVSHTSSGQTRKEAKENGKSHYYLYKSIINAFSNYLARENLLMERITQSQYEQILDYGSIEISYGYNIPYNEFLEQYSLSKRANTGEIEYLSALAFSRGSKESFFICDRAKDKYYRIVVDRDEKVIQETVSKLENTIDMIEERDFIPYYRITNLAGVENGNRVPLYMTTGSQRIQVKKEMSIYDEKKISKLETDFFSSNFDFVRKITENKGTLIYTYGYSEKVLVLNDTGVIEYREEANSNNNYLGFYPSLSSAVSYVSSHGGWNRLISQNITPYLREAEEIIGTDGKKKGYRFTFGIMIDDYPVIYENHAPLIIEVSQNQIISYRRDMISQDHEGNSNNSSRIVLPPMDIITRNYVQMCDIINARQKTGDDGKTIKEENIWSSENNQANPSSIKTISTFEDLVGQIKQMQICYFRKNKSVQQSNMDVEPLFLCWQLNTNYFSFFFDVDTGELVGSILLEE